MLGSVEFSATASPTPQTVQWYLDGAPQGEAGFSGGAWRWTWTFGPATTAPGAQPAVDELVDGLYIVGAKAFDRYGQYGSVRSVTMAVNRRAPFAPRNLRPAATTRWSSCPGPRTRRATSRATACSGSPRAPALPWWSASSPS
jgi:hypothetical protein